jgi:hypothetical protein
MQLVGTKHWEACSNLDRTIAWTFNTGGHTRRSDLQNVKTGYSPRLEKTEAFQVFSLESGTYVIQA